MIALEKVDTDFEGTVWSDEINSHVIVEETENTYRFGSGGPGFYVRDEDGEEGPYKNLSVAFDAARERWGEVELGPAYRLRLDVEEGRTGDLGQFLLEYLAEYGSAGVDVQALALRVFERVAQY